jgi:N-acetylglucosamine kinase-like BadF-type ATPase
MRFFLGIDGGGSNTHAVVVNDVFQVIGRGHSGASNHYAVGPEDAAFHCREAAQMAFLDAGRIERDLQPLDIAAWGFGLAGVRRERDAATMRAQLAAVVQGRPFVLDHDAAAAQSGAFSGGPGIVLSAGTGAICFGVDEQGERFFADGWGPILGDEGGGFWIGQETLKAVCRAQDGRGPRTSLVSPVLSTLNVADCDELVQLIYSPDLRRDVVARLAQVVFDAAGAGGRVACEIRERAAVHLSNSVVAVARAMLTRARERAGLEQPVPVEIAVALRGGLFEDGHFRGAVGYNIGERLVEMRRDYWPLSGWRIVKPQFEAAVGAALLAQKHVESPTR